MDISAEIRSWADLEEAYLPDDGWGRMLSAPPAIVGGLTRMRAKNAGASGLPERRESYDHNRATGLDCWAVVALANVAEKYKANVYC